MFYVDFSEDSIAWHVWGLRAKKCRKRGLHGTHSVDITTTTHPAAEQACQSVCGPRNSEASAEHAITFVRQASGAQDCARFPEEI